MSEIQERVLGRIKAIAADNGFIAVQQSKYENTGIVYFQTEDFDSPVYVHYEFQTAVGTLIVFPEPTAADGAAPTCSWPDSMPASGHWYAFHLDYRKGGTIRNALNYIAKQASLQASVYSTRKVTA